MMHLEAILVIIWELFLVLITGCAVLTGIVVTGVFIVMCVLWSVDKWDDYRYKKLIKKLGEKKDV